MVNSLLDPGKSLLLQDARAVALENRVNSLVQGMLQDTTLRRKH